MKQTLALAKSYCHIPEPCTEKQWELGEDKKPVLN